LIEADCKVIRQHPLIVKMDLIRTYDAFSSGSSSDDSEFEFELNFRPRSSMSIFDEEVHRPSGRVFDSEYYNLPLIENLKLDDEKTSKLNLWPMGTVSTIIDFIVTIKPNEDVPSLDYDTVLFNENSEVLGSIFEIFGLISEPMYGIRFNSGEEAQKCQPGMKVMYDPENYELTHKSIVDAIASKMKIADDGHESDFSDDEAEQQHLQKKRAKTRTSSVHSTSTFVPPQKRAK